MTGFGANAKENGRRNERAKTITSSGEDSFKTAIQFHVRGDIVSAEAAYRKAIKAGFNHQALFSNLGVICRNSDRPEEAVYLYTRATEINPEYPHAYTNLGEIYKDLGNLDQALAFTLKSVEIKPDNPDALTNLGGIYKKLGNLDQALAANLKSLELKPDNPTAHMNLGGIYKNLGNLDQALASTLKSLELKPDNPTAHMNLGNIYKDLGNLDQALASTLKSLELKPDNPDALINLGGIYKDLGNLDQALASTLKSIELKPDNPDALINLGDMYKDLGNLDQALASTLKSLELKPDNPDALINLGSIYKNLGNLDQALASTLKSIELKPENSKALYSLGTIKMTLGEEEEAKKNLLDSIKINLREYGAYFELSRMLKTAEEAEEIVKSINSAKEVKVTPKKRLLIEFALSNCFHKAKNYDKAAKHLQLANKNKLIAFPSDEKQRRQAIANSLSDRNPAKTTNINMSSGKERIFLVGMPRSGSTLLETILSMNPEIKDLGESRSLGTAIAKLQQLEECKFDHHNLNELYSQIEPLDSSQYKYSTDKSLYNFININWIATHMPAAKIIHCRRNPMDNILSMYRSNLTAGNNYTANPEDAAKVLVAQEQAMQIQKKRYPEKIFTFDYDQFVHAPEDNLRKLLRWLDLEFDDNYLHPEESTRAVNTASVMQARKPISNKSVGGWKNYKNLLKPALAIIQKSGMTAE